MSNGRNTFNKNKDEDSNESDYLEDEDENDDRDEDEDFNYESDNGSSEDSLELNSEDLEINKVGSNKNHTGLLSIRADNSTTMINDKNKEIDIKTTFMYNASNLKTAEEMKFVSKLSEEFANVQSFRPVGEVIAYSDHGSPLSIKTPNKTILHLTEDFKTFKFYSNMVTSPIKAKRRLDLSEDNEFFDSEIYKKVKKPKSHTKTKSVEIRNHKKFEKNKRPKTQKQVMGGGATEYVKKTGLVDTDQDWSHIAPNKYVGKKSQDESFIVSKNKHVNTKDLMVELNLPVLLKKYPSVKWEGKAELIPKTQIALTSGMKIKTKDFTVDFSMNAQQENKPSKILYYHIKGLFSSLVNTFNESNDNALNNNNNNNTNNNNNQELIAKRSLFKK